MSVSRKLQVISLLITTACNRPGKTTHPASEARRYTSINMRTHLSFITILINALLITSCIGISHAKDFKANQYYSDPQAIIEEVSKRDASEVVAELSDNQQAWYYIIDQISAGETEWLKVAVALRPGTDAGGTEDIFGALGSALKTNPKEVLQLISDSFPVEHVCSWPIVGTPPCTTYDFCIKEIEKRQKSIKNISNNNLCQSCLNCLENGKKEIADCFGIMKEDK